MDISSITDLLIEAGTAENYERLPAILPSRNAYHAYLMELCANRLSPAEQPSIYAYDAYYAIAAKMEHSKLIGYIKMLTIAENTFAHSGSVSPVIWLFRKAMEKDGFHYHMSGNMYGVSLLARDFQRRPGTLSEHLADWVMSHATNPYLPFGTQAVHSKNIHDLHAEADAWTRRAEEYSKRKAEEDAAAKARRLQKATVHEQALAEQAILKAQRDQIIAAMKRLPTPDMVSKIIHDREHPVFFHESLLTALTAKDLIGLPRALRTALIDYLEPIKRGKLHKLREQIKRIISESDTGGPPQGVESHEP